MISVNLIFDHHVKRDEIGNVEVRVTRDRKTWYLKTGVRVRRSEFVGGCVVDRYDNDVLNERLRTVVESVNKGVAVLMKRCEEINGKALRTFVDGGDKIKGVTGKSVRVAKNEAKSEGCEDIGGLMVNMDDTPFISWIEASIGKLGLREGTLKHYVTLVSRLKEWGEMTRWEDVRSERIVMFDEWLRGLESRWGGKRDGKTGRIGVMSDAAVYNYHKTLKAMLSRAMRSGIIEANPYDKLKGVFKRGDVCTVEYLTEDEFCKIKGLIIMDERLRMAQSLFVAQCMTGLSYADLMEFDMSDYSVEDGRYVTMKGRVKTGVEYICVLTDEVLRIVEEYDGRLPRMTNQEYNRLLKVLGEMAGIKKCLHSHVARHTFATMMLRKGVKLENVSKMLGHSNVVQTQRYAKVMKKSVIDEFGKIGW